MIEAPLEINGFKFHIVSTMNNAGVLVDPTTAQFDDPRFIEAFKIVCEMHEPFMCFQMLGQWMCSAPSDRIAYNNTDELYRIINMHDEAMQHPRVAVFMNQHPSILRMVQEVREEIKRRKDRDEKKARAALRKTKSRDGYVYLIKAETGHFKIGRTHSPNDRIATFGVKLPFDVEYLAVIPTPDMYQLEAILHNKYSDKRVKGEWFSLTPDDVIYIKSLEAGVS